MTEPLPQPTPELPPAIGPGPSPLWPTHLVDLFFRPTRFFTGQLALGKTPYVLLVTWVLGMSAAIDRIDTRILQADMRDDPARWDALERLLATWPRFWGFVIVVGILGGAFQWWVGGWWCRVRLRWCGAPAPDAKLARLLLIYSSFVFAGPAVVGAAVQTARYPSYLAAYEHDVFVTLLVMVMVFWSVATTYKGAIAMFPVRRTLARVWFVALPVLFFFSLMGGVAALVAAAS